MPDEITLKLAFLTASFIAAFHFLNRYYRGNPMVRPDFFLFTPYLNNAPRFQLNAIPTVGFSDPILSYVSVVQYILNGDRILRNGYEKVICLSLFAPSRIRSMMPLSTFRQIRVYSKSPNFGDGWC